MEKLSADAAEARMDALPEWALSGDVIQRTFGFGGFPAAMAFVHQVAELAESAQHHPAIMIRYDKVTLTLSTHDAGGLTEKDFEFASRADALAAGG